MSLRDELLKVGLINKKQADDADRKQQRQERQPPRQPDNRRSKPQRGAQPPQRPAPPPPPPPPRVDPSHSAAAAKLARDMELNRKIQEKAEKKARNAQIAQLIKQHRLLPVESEESYNFVDGAKIRRIAVTAALRSALMKGEILIVRHEANYDLIPASLAERLRERDPQVFITSGAKAPAAPADDAYAQFQVPDDLQW